MVLSVARSDTGSISTLPYWSHACALRWTVSPMTLNTGRVVVVIATRAAGPGRAVASTSAGGSPRTTAAVDSAPATVPNVHRVAARPAESARPNLGEERPPRPIDLPPTVAPATRGPS